MYINEVPVIPTLITRGQTCLTPTPSEYDSPNNKPPLSTRSKGAVSHIVKWKKSGGHGHVSRPQSAPGNLIWNKVVFLGSRGSTNIFATTASSSRNDSFAEEMSSYPSLQSTPKEAWRSPQDSRKTTFVQCWLRN